MLHVYWECKETKDLWKQAIIFAQKNITDEVEYDKCRCLLSAFETNILVLFTTIVKYHIFLARINKWPLDFQRLLASVKRERDTDLQRTKPENMNSYYAQWGALIGDSVFK